MKTYNEAFPISKSSAKPTSDEMPLKFIKIPKKFWDNLKFEIKVPTLICVCGKKILDTPCHREYILKGKNNHDRQTRKFRSPSLPRGRNQNPAQGPSVGISNDRSPSHLPYQRTL